MLGLRTRIPNPQSENTGHICSRPSGPQNAKVFVVFGWLVDGSLRLSAEISILSFVTISTRKRKRI